MSPWFTADADDFDPDDLDGVPVHEVGGHSGREPEATDFADQVLSDALDDALTSAMQAEHQRVERAIRGAIRAGYDGVDINRPAGMDSFGIQSIEPWRRPAPEGDNGYRTTRYSWDWFSEGELARLLSDSEYMARLAGELRGGGRDE